MAETQSFVLQTRDCQGNPADDHIMDPIHAFGLEPSEDEKDEQSSNGRSFHLGLSDSSHLQCQAQALAMESTQAFVPVDRNLNLEDTQAYAAISTVDRAAAENAINLEATQAYGVDEEPARCSVMTEKEGQVDLALEATQAYISEPYSDSENETDEKNSGAETRPLDCPTSSTLARAETQPISGFEDEESLATDKSVSFAQQLKSRTQNETEGREKHVAVAQPQERFFSEAVSIVETQPMHTYDNEESNDEHSGPQMLTNSRLFAVETQPVVAVEDQESDDEELIPGPRKRKAKPLQLEEEQTQSLTNSELSVVETQPMDTVEDGESDEDSIPVFRKRRAKPLQLEETQPLSSPGVFTVETQPMGACEDEESSNEDSIPGPHKRKAKPLQLEDEQTQPLTNSEVCAVETQPTVMGEDEERSYEESFPGQRKIKTKVLQLKQEEPQMLANFEVSTVEIQPLETNSGVQSEPGTSGVTVRNKRGTWEKLKKEEQWAKCSDPSKRQTKGKNKALPNNRGRRGQSRLDEDESEEEEEVEQPRKARGKKSVSQQKDKEEEKQLETKISQHIESNSLIKEKHEGRVGGKKDVANLRQQEREKMEKENGEIVEMKRKQEEIEGQHREEQEELQRERKEIEEQERLQAENAERVRLEEENTEKNEQEEHERYDQTQEEKEKQLERERRENEEKILGSERKEQEHQARLEREERERLEKEKETKEKLTEEQQESKEEETMLKVPTRGRRAARRTLATQPEQNSAISTNDDVPARRTRSRSNSSNSVSSERSASSMNTQESRGRGRGRGIKRTSEPPQVATARSSNRRRTVAAETSQQDSNISPQGRRSRSDSSNSLNSEISSCSVVSQIRGRGGRQRGRGRKTELDSIPPVSSQSGQNLTPKPVAKGRKSRRAEGSSNEVSQEDKEKADSQEATTTRGQQQASAVGSEPEAADQEGQSNQEGCHASEESPMTKRNVRGRGQKAVKSENLETPAVNDGDEAKHKRMGRKRELVQNTEEDSSSGPKICRGKEKAQTTDAAEETGKDETKDENPVQAKRRGRASSAQAKKNTKESPPKVEPKEQSENMELETVEKRARGRSSAVQKKKKEEQDENSGTSVSSMSQEANMVASQVT